MKTNALPTIAIGLLCAATTATADITIPMVTVGDPGNPDSQSGSPLGAVSYTYNIGQYEVTVSQYTAFLNAVAATDSYGLYNPFMASNLISAGITQNGSSGSFTYSVIPGMGNHPVTYVSWYDAARFSNWLSNGQPTGAETTGVTETGSYTLTGNTGFPSYNGTGLYRLPTESEWYKAAYYDPSISGYWNLPTRSNTFPPGNIVGSGANMANYKTDPSAGSDGGYSITQSADLDLNQNYLTDVGSFTGSASAYGTFDQGGNVWELNDAVFNSYRELRGGGWSGNASYLTRGYRIGGQEFPGENPDEGFRVASVVPESSSLALLGVAAVGMASRRNRQARAVR